MHNLIGIGRGELPSPRHVSHRLVAYTLHNVDVMAPEWSWAVAIERVEGGELVAVVVLRWRCAGIIIIILCCAMWGSTR